VGEEKTAREASRRRQKPRMGRETGGGAEQSRIRRRTNKRGRQIDTYIETVRREAQLSANNSKFKFKFKLEFKFKFRSDHIFFSVGIERFQEKGGGENVVVTSYLGCRRNIRAKSE